MPEIFVPREMLEGETRVAIVPETAQRLIRDGFAVSVEIHQDLPLAGERHGGLKSDAAFVTDRLAAHAPNAFVGPSLSGHAAEHWAVLLALAKILLLASIAPLQMAPEDGESRENAVEGAEGTEVAAPKAMGHAHEADDDEQQEER